MTDKKSDVNFGTAMLDGFSVDVSHQEIERIVVELEELYKSQPGEWLPVAGIGAYVAEELGYEDADEFEDALKCTFEEFIGKLPHVETGDVESELAPGTFRRCFKVTSGALASDGGNDGSSGAEPRIMRLRVKENSDLWRVFMKSPGAEMEIPEIEFYVGADSKRVVDSVYNHVATAVFNLESHVAQMATSGNEEERKGIMETVEKLRALLDLNGEFTIVVTDREGTCAFKPSEGVEIEPLSR
jgi:mediator of RNA polymerase II transcription subunit 31